MSARRQDKALSDWISRADLVRELGVTTGTLARWTTERTGPPMVRVGRRIFYRRSAVRKWLVERERKTGHG